MNERIGLTGAEDDLTLIPPRSPTCLTMPPAPSSSSKESSATTTTGAASLSNTAAIPLLCR